MLPDFQSGKRAASQDYPFQYGGEEGVGTSPSRSRSMQQKVFLRASFLNQ